MKVRNHRLVNDNGTDVALVSSQSRSHGGFDNDAPTMNSVLYRILGGPPRRPFTPRDLDYD